MHDPRQHLHRGFNWLGGATIAVKLIDLTTLLAVLWFMSKPQVGIASLVIAVGTIIEALDGLGTREALIQARRVSRRQLDSLFWFIAATALLLAALAWLVAPALGTLYGVAGMSGYFVAIAAKQPIVGAALIPLAMMNRDLQYERIAVVNVAATLGAALTRIGLAIAGAGAWALVAGYLASGVYTLVGAQIARPFWPRLRFRAAAIAPLVRFGSRAVTSHFLDQLFNNAHYLLIGWFYGPAQLAVYRVAFTVAMEPAIAVSTLINRTALPVFARVSALGAPLAATWLWSLRRAALLIEPFVAVAILAARPITALIHDGRGGAYAAAAVPLEWLAVAALLRVLAQLLAPLVIATGRPVVAARVSAVTLLLLVAGLALLGGQRPAPAGLVAVAAVWAAIYPPLLLWEARYLRRHWGIGIAALARAFVIPSIGTAALVAIVATARWAIGAVDPRLQLAIVLVSAIATYAVLFRQARPRALPAA